MAQSSNQDLELLITADTKGVKTGMKEAEQAVVTSDNTMKDSVGSLAAATKAAMADMMAQLKAMGVQHTSTMAQAANDTEAASSNIASKMKMALGSVNSDLTGVGTGIQGMMSKFLLVGAVLAGAGLFKEGIETTKEMTVEANKLGRALGISASEASVMAVGLDDVYSSTDDMLSASQKLSRQLRTNEEGLNKMGLATRDSNGEYRNMKDIMMDSITVANSYKEGTDRNLATQILYGRAGEEVTNMLRLNTQVMEDARKKALELGLVVGVENVQATKEYRAAMNDVGDVLEAVKKAIGDAVMPMFTRFGEWFAEIGPAAVIVFKGALGGLMTMFWGLVTGVTILWETINAMVVSVAEPLRGLVAAMYAAFHGDWSEAKKELMSIGPNIATAWSGAMTEIEKSSQDTHDKIANLFGKQTEIAAKPEEGKDFVDPKEKKAKEKKDESKMGDYEAELNERKVAYQEMMRAQGSFQEFSKQQELDFWQEKLTTVKKGSDDERAIHNKVATNKLALDKQAFEVEMAGLRNSLELYKNNVEKRMEIAELYAQKMLKAYGEESTQYAEAQKQIISIKLQADAQIRAIEAEHSKAVQARAIDDIASERQLSEQRTALGLQTKAEEVAQESEFEDRMYQIKKAAMDAKKQLLVNDPFSNPVEKAKIDAELEQLEVQHNQRLRQLAIQKDMEDKKRLTGFVGSVKSNFQQAFQGILSGSQGLTTTINGLFKGLTGSIAGYFAEMAADWIAQQLAMAIFGKATNQSAVTSASGLAGANGVASFAAAPWPINMGAPAFGAAMAASAMSFGAIASAEGGFDIPAGVNPITQLHEQEMVLPKAQANVVRDMAANGSGAGQVNVNIHALDAKSVENYFKKNSHVLAPGLRNMARNFTPVKGK